MASKGYLVARRELLENLRTRTFWIGILLFPLILVLAVLVPALLERGSPTRVYAVVDHSGWLLEEIDQRAAQPDLEKVLIHALELWRAGDPAFGELPEELRGMVPAIERAVAMAGKMGISADEDDAAAGGASGEDDGTGGPPEGRSPAGEGLTALERQVITGMAFGLTHLAEGPAVSEVAGFSMPDVGEDGAQQLRRTREAIRRWWRELPEERAAELAEGETRQRYRRVELPDATGEELIDELNRQVAESELFAYFVIGEDPVEGDAGGRYVSANLTDDDLRRWFSGLASDVVRERRLEQHDVDPEVVRWIEQPVRFDVRRVAEGGAEEEVGTQDLVRQWAPPVFVYLLWVSIFSISQMLLTNTVEEKSNRIMEVLLSSLSPLQLMAGKISGIALTGLTMIGTWVLFFYFAVKTLPRWLGIELDFDLGVIISDPTYILSFVVYFLLGYLFFATLFVGIGSLCSTLKEAQNLQTPVTLTLLVPIFAMIPVARDPNGPLAVTLSYIPPFTPFVMMNRAAGPPSPIEYVLTTLLLLAAIAVVLWVTAKVFRIGILMSGKPPRLREILKWLRAPVGTVPERRRPPR